MAVIQDNFEYARIPLKPLPYTLNELAQYGELLIDYTGDNPSYNIWITCLDQNNNKELVNITPILTNGNNVEIDASNFVIKIGNNSYKLADIYNNLHINYPYIYADKESQYENLNSIKDLATTQIKPLKDKGGNYILPMVLTDCVFDANGNKLSEILAQSKTKLAFSNYSFLTSNDGNNNFKTSYEIDLPYENYDGYIDIRIGSVFIDNTRYHIEISNENAKKATLTFDNNTLSEEIGRKVDILYMYNAVSEVTSSVIDGNSIADRSIPISKLTKVTNTWVSNDPTAIPTSRALYNFVEFFSNYKTEYMIIDNSSNSYITCRSDKVYDLVSGNITDGPKSFVLTIATLSQKSTFKNIHIYNSDGSKYFNQSIKIYDAFGNAIADGSKVIPEGKVIRLLIDINDSINKKAYLISENIYSLERTYYRYQEQNGNNKKVSYSGLAFDTTSLINVYRNGVRLFENYDYTQNIQSKEITLKTFLQKNEIIMFEAITS